MADTARRPKPPRIVALVIVSLTAILYAGCREEGLPEPDTLEYREAVASFYAGLAGIQTGAHPLAVQKLRRVTELAPDEPAAWANLGLLAMREGRLDEAYEHLSRAESLAPEQADVLFLLGALAQRRGDHAAAIEHFRRALELEPDDLRTGFALVQTLESRGDPDAAQQLLDELLRRHPDNIPLRLEQVRLAAAHEEAELLRRAADDIVARATGWPPELQQHLERLERAAQDADFRSASEQAAFLENALVRSAEYRESLAALRDEPGQEGTPLLSFVRLPSPIFEPAPPDTSMTFVADSLGIDGGPWQWVGALPLAGTGVLTLAVANGRTLKMGTGATLAFPGGSEEAAPGLRSVAVLDYDNDYRMDIVTAGRGGVRLYRQEGSNAFVDVTRDMDLPAGVRGDSYSGVWAADLDMEGDLDLLLARSDAPPVVLRNNGDGTFSTWRIFEGVGRLVDFEWADLDGDGDPDAALLDASGTVHLYANERGGQFDRFSGEIDLTDVRAVAVADLDADGRLELITVDDDGAIRRQTVQDGPSGLITHDIAYGADQLAGDTVSLHAADFDNNGAVDVLVSTSAGARLWLNGTYDEFRAVGVDVSSQVFDVADLGGSGRLDLLSLSAGGQPVHSVNRGVFDYASKTIELRAARTTGDQRINSFGIGGTVEVRSGLLYQKQRITAPAVHFGLGRNDLVDVARIIWPNGTVQAEFDLETDQTVMAQQRLKGSCPWVFTNDGEGMRFVTDFLWRTALGLRINAQEGTNVMHGVDWIKIASDQLQPVDGEYEVRITADLWETHFFDEVALMTVDRPAGTEVLIDERFALPAPEWTLHPTEPLQPVAGATDAQGRDVTELVRNLDGRYLDTFELGRFQGVAEEHFVEVELDRAALGSDRLWLVASGWVRPTDSSINFAIAQGSHEPPFGLQLDVPDGRGGWTTARSDLGFPAGKAKTMLIDLSDVLEPGGPARVRLRTNMEIYWDRIAWTRGRADVTPETRRLRASAATLRYRGFSVVRQPGHSSPEVPVYDTLAATTPQWVDLVGFYTRFGDVRELVTQTDDRYVIMNAGDELVLRFEAPPPPADGWVRDFVLIGDGWVKDGDFNTGFSTTVGPLPYHGLTDYSTAPARLEDDPVYQRFPQDWQRYHTRYVTPAGFQQALVIQPEIAGRSGRREAAIGGPP